MGNWVRTSHGDVRVAVRKLLFDGGRRNFGDLRVTGTLGISGNNLEADWLIWVVDTEDRIIVSSGTARSEGPRID